MLGLLVFSSYSYSNDDTVYGQTGNASASSLDWVMRNIIPQQAGLTISNVIYQYTTVKETADDMVVHVQNENALGSGYIFRSSDDWSGKPGNTINKIVPVPNVDLSFWGDGSIEVDGIGAVVDPSVIYTYQYKPCFDPQSDPTCPGWIDPQVQMIMDGTQVVEVYDPLSDEYIQQELAKKAQIEEENLQEKNRRVREQERKTDRLERILGVVNVTLLASEAEIKATELFALNYIPSSYNKEMKGGVYNDKPTLKDNKLPVNLNARKVGLAQQLLHEDMVNSQYQN